MLDFNDFKQRQTCSLVKGRQWHYLTVKNLSALLRGTTSKHHCDFYCLNSLHSFATKSKLELNKKIMWE